MSVISDKKKDRIKEDIIRELYENYPGFLYTEKISENIIRDNEFTLSLLNELKKNKVVNILNETKGDKVKRKWQLNEEAFDAYKRLSV
ncbi:hypothetical protein J4405_01650 [Candidatus Woesearchaeota archaeon]|nr:hypothetical protein [Candidatus Woesearchaeota archaeon]